MLPTGFSPARPVEQIRVVALLLTQSPAAAVQALGPSTQSVTESQQSIPEAAGSAGCPVCIPTGVSASQYQLLAVGPAAPVLQTTRSSAHGELSPHGFGPSKQASGVA